MDFVDFWTILTANISRSRNRCGIGTVVKVSDSHSANQGMIHTANCNTPFTRYNRLSIRLYRVNGVLQPVWQQVVSCKRGLRVTHGVKEGIRPNLLVCSGNQKTLTRGRTDHFGEVLADRKITQILLLIYSFRFRSALLYCFRSRYAAGVHPRICDGELWPLTLTFELNLDSAMMIQHDPTAM